MLGVCAQTPKAWDRSVERRPSGWIFMTFAPETSVSEFWRIARVLATYSARAYRDATATDAETNASAIVILDQDGDIIVAFKGSNQWGDFVQDAKCWLTKLSKRSVKRSILLYPRSSSKRPVAAEVHQGFLEDWNALNIAVLSQVNALLAANPTAKIYITGHSLGGGIAILCATEFARLKKPVAGIFTFGQPRVGNHTFKMLYNHLAGNLTPLGYEPRGVSLLKKTFHIVNQNDLVPRLPGWLMGYRHVGTEVFLTPRGGWCVSPSLLRKFIYDALGLWGAFRKWEDVLIRDHFIAAYQERIKGL